MGFQWGHLESGRFYVGSEGALATNPARRIKITGIESMCGDVDLTTHPRRFRRHARTAPTRGPERCAGRGLP